MEQFTQLVTKGRPVFLRGAIAVGNFYMFAPQNVFDVREGVTGQRDSTRFFVFRYADPKESARTVHASADALRANEVLGSYTSTEFTERPPR